MRVMEIKKEIEYQQILRCINGVADHKEIKEYKLWLDSDIKHRHLVEHLKANNNEIIVSKQSIDLQWEKLHSNITKPKIQIRRNWLQYAAAILILIISSVSITVFVRYNTPHVVCEQIIQPGSSKATLTLGNGQLFVLNDSIPKTIKNTIGDIVGVDTLNTLHYIPQVKSEEIEYNTIQVPRGGEYKLVLADGSTVWLNSQTKLRFPIAFHTNKREVYLEGEALFDVTSDAQHPFIVHTNYSSVKVYGTIFNVMSYSDEKEEQMTLVEGSVALLYGDKELLIRPGQQSVITKNSRSVTIREVDVNLYADWNKGVFRFENMPLNEVMQKIARWYDVQFFFANEEVKTRNISGAMKRNTDFEKFMELIGKSADAEIKINDKSVLITGKY